MVIIDKPGIERIEMTLEDYVSKKDKIFAMTEERKKEVQERNKKLIEELYSSKDFEVKPAVIVKGVRHEVRHEHKAENAER